LVILAALLVAWTVSAQDGNEDDTTLDPSEEPSTDETETEAPEVSPTEPDDKTEAPQTSAPPDIETTRPTTPPSPAPTTTPPTTTPKPRDPDHSVLQIIGQPIEWWTDEKEEQFKEGVALAVNEHCKGVDCTTSVSGATIRRRRATGNGDTPGDDETGDSSTTPEPEEETETPEEPDTEPPVPPFTISAEDVVVEDVVPLAGAVTRASIGLEVVYYVAVEDGNLERDLLDVAVDENPEKVADAIGVNEGDLVVVPPTPEETTTPTPTTTTPPSTPAPSEGLEPWAIALIVLASVTVASIIAYAIYHFCFKKKKSQKNIESSPYYATDPELHRGETSGNEYAQLYEGDAKKRDSHKYDNPAYDNLEKLEDKLDDIETKTDEEEKRIEEAKDKLDELEKQVDDLVEQQRM